MRVLVLGSGVIGVTSAWYLAQAGHVVTVIDRQASAAQETSFANGGQISVSQSEPWASPHAIKKIIRWLGKEDAPLLFRPQLSWHQWVWGIQFLLECQPQRFRQNIRDMVNLGIYSRATLRQLRNETGIEYDHLSKGILQFFTNERDYQESMAATKLLREFGIERVIKSPDEVVAIEPAMVSIKSKLLGAYYAASDESGDAQKFTTQLAERCLAIGVKFQFNTHIKSLRVAADAIDGVMVECETGVQTLTADSYVVALGSYSPLLLRPLGISIPVYPAKGYSATFSTEGFSAAPTVSLTDEEQLIVFSRLGHRLRVAGTAELNGYNTALNMVRCEALRKRAQALFPDAADFAHPQYWTGLRPSTPSNCPLIGRTAKYINLFLNTGHGTLGWTEGCGSAKALADIVSGRKPEVEYRFLGGVGEK